MLREESVGQPAKFSLFYDSGSPHAPAYYFARKGSACSVAMSYQLANGFHFSLILFHLRNFIY
jgi:hypothetical protein